MAESAITRASVLAALAHHVGRENGITARNLVIEICGLFAHTGDERTLRHVIEELRREGRHICGTPRDGYFIAETDDELDETLRFLFDRAMTTLTQVAAIRRVSLPDLRGQLRLPT